MLRHKGNLIRKVKRCNNGAEIFLCKYLEYLSEWIANAKKVIKKTKVIELNEEWQGVRTGFSKSLSKDHLTSNREEL